MKKVIISGANSFIGRHLIAQFQKHEWSVTAVVRSEQAAADLPGEIRVISLGLSDYEQIGAICGPCDCFVHLAWNGTRGAQRMDCELQLKNYDYSMKGIKSLIEAGCKSVVLAGSQAEYAPSVDMITEESSAEPITEYGKAKLRLYKECMELCRKTGTACKEARIFSIYGPGDYTDTMVMKMLKNMLSDKECCLTECIQKWDFLYIEDAAEALYGLCANECADGVYNLGSGDVRPLRDYVLEMKECASSASVLRFGAVPYPTTGMVSLWPDITKISRELNWRPCISFSDGVQKMIIAFKGEKNEAL